MTRSVRERIADNIVETLLDMREPQLVKVTREPFNVEELAITQFPAALVGTGIETRDSVSMGGVGSGIRQGTITYNINLFVRGNELDSKRNHIIESVEEALDVDRKRGETVHTVLDAKITQIEVVQRQPPLAEVFVTYQVDYVFRRGTA